LKTLFLFVAGMVFLALGLFGLVVPLIPGFLFLLVAAACFAAAFPRFRASMNRNPRMRRFFHRLDAGADLHPLTRVRLAFWASLEAASPRQKRH